MQFRINITGSSPDIARIEEVIRELDPAVSVDIDPTGQTLRVATLLDGMSLLEQLSQAGCLVGQDRLERVPSECCGGCGG